MPQRNKRWVAACHKPGNTITSNSMNATNSTPPPSIGDNHSAPCSASTNSSAPAFNKPYNHAAALRPPRTRACTATGKNCSKLPTIALPRNPSVKACTTATLAPAQRDASTMSPPHTNKPPANTPQMDAVSRKRCGMAGSGACWTTSLVMPTGSCPHCHCADHHCAGRKMVTHVPPSAQGSLRQRSPRASNASSSGVGSSGVKTSSACPGCNASAAASARTRGSGAGRARRSSVFTAPVPVSHAIPLAAIVWCCPARKHWRDSPPV